MLGHRRDAVPIRVKLEEPAIGVALNLQSDTRLRIFATDPTDVLDTVVAEVASRNVRHGSPCSWPVQHDSCAHPHPRMRAAAFLRGKQRFGPQVGYAEHAKDRERRDVRARTAQRRSKFRLAEPRNRAIAAGKQRLRTETLPYDYDVRSARRPPCCGTRDYVCPATGGVVPDDGTRRRPTHNIPVPPIRRSVLEILVLSL